MSSTVHRKYNYSRNPRLRPPLPSDQFSKIPEKFPRQTIIFRTSCKRSQPLSELKRFEIFFCLWPLLSGPWHHGAKNGYQGDGNIIVFLANIPATARNRNSSRGRTGFFSRNWPLQNMIKHCIDIGAWVSLGGYHIQIRKNFVPFWSKLS